MKKKILTILVTLTAYLLCFNGIVLAKKTTLLLHWLPQAQFAGYYVALEKGYYRDAGVDLTLLHGGADSVSADSLASGEAQFATMFLAAAIERKAAGIPLVNVGQIVQHSALMILTKKSAGIKSITELDGKRIAMWANDFQPQPWGLFKEHDIQVVNIPFSGSMQLFLKDAVPATLAMWYNGYHTVLSAGFREDELQPFFFSDTQFDFPEDGIYCLSKTIEKNPEHVRKVVEATLKGWKYAFNHKAETLKIVSNYMEKEQLPVSESHQGWMLDIMEKIVLAKTDQDTFGQLDQASYNRVVKALSDVRLGHYLPTYDEFVWSVQNDD